MLILDLPQQTLPEKLFNYDLKEMQQAIESGVVDVPQNAKRDFAQFQVWLNQSLEHDTKLSID
ncbi:MAG: hypothetical protein Q4D05_09230 [Acinetobacter sp.]|nr:hypothetical protein [Acinetobacter sp.]